MMRRIWLKEYFGRAAVPLLLITLAQMSPKASLAGVPSGRLSAPVLAKTADHDSAAAVHPTGPHPNRSPLDAEPTAAAAVRGLTMRTLDGGKDCDQNGIADSLDILAGRIQDRNHNGVDDWCDDDVSVRSAAFSQSWKTLAARPDTEFFEVYNQRPRGKLGTWIRYTVPPGGARVALFVANPAGRTVRRLLSGRRASGAYDLVWDQKDDRGVALPDSTDYTVTLRVGSRSFSRSAMWRRAPFVDPALR